MLWNEVSWMPLASLPMKLGWNTVPENGIMVARALRSGVVQWVLVVSVDAVVSELCFATMLRCV